MKRIFVVLAGWFVLSIHLFGQAPNLCRSGEEPGIVLSSEVGCVIPNIFGGSPGIVLGEGLAVGHEAHFIDTPQSSTSGFTQNFLPLNTAIATQLALLPIASPASAFTYRFEPAGGVFTRTAQTLGPILTERGETIGQRKFHFGFNFQGFRFQEIDGQDMSNLALVLTHVPVAQPPQALKDVITTVNDFRLKMDQYTLFGTFGVTNRFDVSVAVPIVSVDLDASSTATIRRAVTGADNCPPSNPDRPCHAYDVNDRSVITRTPYENQSNASGLGDVTLRLKYNAVRGEHVVVSFLTDVRFPTGDEREFLGSGAVGVKPFAAITIQRGPFSPHFNIGWQWNGESQLAGELVTGTKGDVPNQFFYSAGADIGLGPRVTFVADFLGQRISDSAKLVPSTYKHPLDASITFPQHSFTTSALTLNNLGLGFKVSLADTVLFTANVLFRLDDAGLRANVVPLFGLSYTF